MPPYHPETKLNMGAQLQTFPYPMIPKPFLYSNAINSFMVKSVAQTLSFKSISNKKHILIFVN